MKASLRLEAAQRPQWPRLYLLSRPRSRGCMPSLVGDGGLVLQVLGWALTRIRNLPLVRYSQAKGAVRWLCVEQSCEFGDLRVSQPPSIFVTPVSGLPLMVSRSTNQKLPRVL